MATSEVVDGLEYLIAQSNIKESYEEYRKTEDYTNYLKMVQLENPKMSEYLIDLCIFGYWYEELYEKKSDEKSILEQEEKHYEPVRGDMKNMIYSYDSMEEYLATNDVKPVLTTGIPLTLEETKTIEDS